MSNEVTDLTSANFDSHTSKGKWAIDFWASWCGPCVMMKPIFEGVAKDMAGKVKFGKVDIDSQTDLAERFGVMSIPTILLLENGEVVDTSVGYVTKDVLSKNIKAAFG